MQNLAKEEVATLWANHEEADTHLILHAKDAIECHFKRVVVMCRDTCSSTAALSSGSYRCRSVDGIRHGKTEKVLPSSCTAKNIRRFYGKITGNQLPVHFSLFLQVPVKLLCFTCAGSGGE